MAIKERPTVVHCRLDDGVGGTAVMGTNLEGSGARPVCRAGTREVPNPIASEAAHVILAVCNLMVEGEAPEAATIKTLKEVHPTCTQMSMSRAFSIVGLVVVSAEQTRCSGGNEMRLWMLFGGKVSLAWSWEEIAHRRRAGQEREMCLTPLHVRQRTGSRQSATKWSEARHLKQRLASRL
jgi:hypothetical protein